MRCFPLLLLVILAPGSGLAWTPNGVRLTGAFDAQTGPEIVSDGAGGAFVSWADWRDFSPLNSGTDLYLQRVTSAGQIAPGWPVDGLAIATGPRTQGNEWRMAADGSGGVLILYGDTRFDDGDLYLQRITAGGEIAPGWPAGGVAIVTAVGYQGAPELAADGGGGAFVSWQDGLDVATTRAHYTLVLASGQLAAGWPVEGRLFEPSTRFALRPLMFPTHAGGFLACWPVSDDTLSTVRLLGQRFGADGLPDGTWPEGGVTICSLQPRHRVPRDRLVPDGTGGFYTVFSDYRNSPPSSPFAEDDLYAQHVLGSGAVAPGWPADALAVSALPGVPEEQPSLCEDGRGGVLVAWVDYRSGYARIFGQHLTADGQPFPGWPARGLSLTDRPGFQLRPQLAWDGVYGAYLAWMNLESSGYKSYVQHLTAGGTAASGWPPSGLPVIPLATDQYVPKIAADGLGGAIVAWEDTRGGEIDVYAQRYITDGVVATRVSLASAESGPDEVRLRWHVSGETRANVERREAEGAWQVLAQLNVDGAGYMGYVDRDVVPGTSYDYRLAFASGMRGGETTVQVPALTLALEGARPNPAVGALWLAFTLPDASAARLELFDLAGRQLSARDVGAHGPGRHVLRLDDGALAPGLYWASLTQGRRTLRARVAVVK